MAVACVTAPDASTLARRLHAPGPKAILSLDGGGTRGVVTLAFLERMEAVLCGSDPAARLSDHFDLIGGTSTGAIIAASLALGWRVAEIRALYDSFAHSVFRRRWYRISPLVNRYDAARLEAVSGLLEWALAEAGRRGLKFRPERSMHWRAVPADPRLTERLASAVRLAGVEPRQLVSGAGHDAAVMASVAPMAMLFVRSPGGISHHPSESVRLEDVQVALDVLIRFLLSLETDR